MHELRQRVSVYNEWDEVPAVMANEPRLSQVFVNLLVNAAQSFGANDPTQNEVHVRVRATGNEHVTIEISDNGPGIPLELQPRIFEPFFTTKPLGEGTGLGLSISRSLIASLNGELSYESELGRGTTFRISLPVATPQKPAVSEAPPRYAPLGEAPKACVLIIDDEPAIARSMQHVLGEQHDVTVCTDPRAALLVLEERGDDFDVIFCDLMMPFMSGMELYQRCLSRAPQLAARFVFMTGAAVDQVVQGFLRKVEHPPLEKPFAFEPLSKLVNKLLRARRDTHAAGDAE
jgi:CheY-like chemotaxis protein/anti-sigma regulatory factor (Ser/Thr protein kinase)